MARQPGTLQKGRIGRATRRRARCVADDEGVGWKCEPVYCPGRHAKQASSWEDCRRGKQTRVMGFHARHFLYSDDMNDESASVGVGSVFPQIQALPGSQGESSLTDRNGFRGFGDGAARVGRHVIGAFGVMSPTSRFRCNIAQPTFQVL